LRKVRLLDGERNTEIAQFRQSVRAVDSAPDASPSGTVCQAAMISLFQRQSLQQRLSPQQVQYLKMLQLPIVALEQRIEQELELNPLLEEQTELAQEEEGDTALELENESLDAGDSKSEGPDGDIEPQNTSTTEDEFNWEDFSNGDADGYKAPSFTGPDNEDQEDIPQRSQETLSELLLAQLHLQRLMPDELALAEEIIGNIDDHGYLRRPLQEIVDDLNKFVATTRRTEAQPSHEPIVGDGRFEDYDDVVVDEPFGRDRLITGHERALTTEPENVPVESTPSPGSAPDRPATSFSLQEMSRMTIEELSQLLERGTTATPSNGHAIVATPAVDTTSEGGVAVEGLFTLAEAERILHSIQRLDPPGIGSRTLQECLAVQLEVLADPTPEHRLARRVILEAYHDFTRKHFEKVCDRLECTTEELRHAIDVIRSLNPKPGEGSTSLVDGNYVTPDFVIERDGVDFLVVSNDRTIPPLRINRAYQELLRRGQGQASRVDKDTRRFIREKFEAARWFIASIHQRRQTMLRVMRAIVDLQIEFFRSGPEHLRPMIYKDIAERIGMDISTVCRVVNGKYVQTDYGTFELRYFFSEKLEMVTGEEVSTKVVKARIEEMIAAEDKNSPLSDDAISREMEKLGYNVARRTVAKYREQLNIPVARLRRAL